MGKKNLRMLIYLDDVLQTEGSLEIRTGLREVPGSPHDTLYPPDEPSTLIAYSA